MAEHAWSSPFLSPTGRLRARPGDAEGREGQVTARCSAALSVGTHAPDGRESSTSFRGGNGLLRTVPGLVAFTRKHAETRLQPLGINVSVETWGTEMRFPHDVEAALFRFIQGAIGNITQHSKAKNATILLEYRPAEFSLIIKDDGQGFNVSEIIDVEESGRGRGLFSMRERIGFLGGTSGMESKIGEGTTVWAKVPIGQEIGYAENTSSGS